ncbi:MMPL family transporter [Nocardioides iriomotensis]|uniref:MMPL family transporter n=2 Tax=Nocardioides iriomotensis TaxID=715784 RepID=A0A4Q5J8V9_9ACTN|nr:MMPL family transporter [Nocardioides iriomotensis]
MVTGRRTAGLVALILLGLGGFVAFGVGEAERDPGALDALPAGYDSTRAVELQEQLPARDASTAVVLWTSGEGDGLSRAQVGELASVLDGVRDELDLQQGPPPQPSEDSTAAVGVVTLPGGSATDNADRVEELRSLLRADAPDGVDVAVTGPAAVQADLAAVFQGADVDLLLATAGVVTLLLLITYRSPILWIVPLAVVGVADRLAASASTHTLALAGIPWDESTVGILSVLVFGAGTDYALLLISRYRDELRVTDDRFAAMAHALRRTAEAVLSSATTVVLGLLTLLLSVVPSTRGLGLACAVGVVVAAAFALVVLPAALVVFGRWVFWPRVPRVGQTPLVESRTLWGRVGSVVARRPVLLLVSSAVVLTALATGVVRIDSGLGTADQFLDRPESIAAAERLADSFPAGSTDPVQVLTEDDPGAVRRALAPLDVVQSTRVTAREAGLSRVDVVLTVPPGSDEAERAVGEIRSSLAGLADTFVGGTDAEAVDERAAAGRDRAVILPLIAGLVLLALGLLLRSLVAPVLLVLTVLATYVAALGASWWLFVSVLGFDALDVGVPLLAFLFLVALGVDYNIFLVTRAAEEAREHGARRGMLRALGATGGVITSAGVLLAAVFAVLGVLPLVVLAQLGVVICVGVLLDTLLVRTVVVPALGVVLGDRFWWPRRPGSAPNLDKLAKSTSSV